MIVLMVNKACEWCQVATATGRHTCPIRSVNGELLFKFKGKRHSVVKYVAESAHELVYVGGRLVNRLYKG